MTETHKGKTALVVGSTGITGGSLAAHLAAQGWHVLGLARRPRAAPGLEPVAADLLDPASVLKALEGKAPTHVFYCTWLRHDTEAENVRVNGGMMQTLFDALRTTNAPVQHAALVTGTKQYLGPFEAYGQTAAETPFREDNPRLPGLNFYYTQEDILFAEAAKSGFSWSVHRPHSMIGFAHGNAMNMGVTLAVYASLCRESGEPFVFPGSHFQWNAIADVTDARLLARHLEWASITPQAANTEYNVVNGDVFRWRWLWTQLANYFGVEAQGPPEGGTALLAPKMEHAQDRWAALVARHGLREPKLDALASAWHTDGDLGRELECVNDMTRSRVRGFLEYQPTLASFTELFDELKQRKLIPA